MGLNKVSTRGLLKVKLTDSRGLAAGVVILVLILGLLNLAIFGLGVWALVFGIVDIIAVGVNFWAVVWIVVGALVVLSSLGGNK